MFNYKKYQKQNLGENMTKKLSQAAQVAKLLKNKAKDLGMKVKAGSSYFANGNSVTVKVLTGTNINLKKLKDYALMYEAGSFDGMNDIYNYDNVNDSIPQTKYLSVDDDRAQYIVKDLKGDKYDDYTFSVNGEQVRSYYQWVQELKEVTNDQVGFEWFSIFKTAVYNLNNANSNGVTFPLGGKVFHISKNKTNQEAA
jgi:aldehyde:ferredoxin oxidoreductase